ACALFQTSPSPAPGGFAMLSHWLPFLFCSVLSGALADRFDPRRIIQIGMALFVAASLGWGVLFLTGTLQMWHAAALLVIHGFAGVFWHPSAQLLIHDIVGTANLQSAVRLSATGRYLGLLFGPAVGGVFLLAFGPAHGLLVNALIYLPLLLWLWKAPYGPRFRKGAPAPVRAVKGFGDIASTIGNISGNRAIVSMVLLAGVTSFFVGNGYQPQMPEFAHDLGHGDPDLSYSMLVAADAAGALFAGFLLESRGLLQAKPRKVLLLAMCCCCAIGWFSTAARYWLVFVIRFVLGFV